MPAGRIVSDSATVAPKPGAAVLAIVAVSVADWPPVSGLVAGATETVKSLPPPPPTIGCDIWQPLPSLDHVDCMANDPVVNGTATIAPGPELSQAHLSAFSSPPASFQPPDGFWSVMVSAYSWPSTIVTPSSTPSAPGCTKFSPQLPAASVTYGRLVNAMSPTVDWIGPPGKLPSPFQSCQAQNPAFGKLSGIRPCEDTTTYCALRFAAALVFPKWDAAAIASRPIWRGSAAAGSAAPESTHTPASAPPVGYPTCAELSGQLCAPLVIPSQYCVVTPDHSSFAVPMPSNSCCSRGAMPLPSPDRCTLPCVSVVGVPHCEPQDTRYTLGLPVVTPMPSSPPPYDRSCGPASGCAARNARIFASASRVGTRPCRYACPAACDRSGPRSAPGGPERSENGSTAACATGGVTASATAVATPATAATTDVTVRAIARVPFCASGGWAPALSH